jgi:NAD(P)-dependent dehydrogenase (short-subunit alcohol dehydrogenase family)
MIAMGKLEGRRILVTGAASGVGFEVAARFRREGAALVLFDRDAPGLAAHTQAATFVVDLRDPGEVVRAVAAAAERLGGLDGVVCAAGHHQLATLEETTDQLWSDLIAVNLTAPMLIARTALPWLRASGAATIVNVASGSALYPVPSRPGYIASKGGLVALSKALAMDFAPHIRVNCICPGAIDTPMLRNAFSEEQLASFGSGYALGRIATPAEIAEGILYLTGPESSFVTGVALAVDGGRTFH